MVIAIKKCPACGSTTWNKVRPIFEMSGRFYAVQKCDRCSMEIRKLLKLK